MKLISRQAINRRSRWIKRIANYTGNFNNEANRLENELEKEVSKLGPSVLVDHLRLCGNIPEIYGHDTTEEKLYSKYTDVLLSIAFKLLGLRSIVLNERADAADVEVFANNYSFVADAKAFRLSRTAKNQKDFKIQAMDNWKYGKPYAMIVAPIYQLPSRSSQIYEQATTRNVCIFTYTHLSLLVKYEMVENKSKSEELLHRIFNIVSVMNPTKNAVDYWTTINKTILGYSDIMQDLWRIEKMATIESLKVIKQEALKFLASEREKIMKMTREEAIKELIRLKKIGAKIKKVENVKDNGLLNV